MPGLCSRGFTFTLLGECCQRPAMELVTPAMDSLASYSAKSREVERKLLV